MTVTELRQALAGADPHAAVTLASSPTTDVLVTVQADGSVLIAPTGYRSGGDWKPHGGGSV